jgi:hypothetical protein
MVSAVAESPFHSRSHYYLVLKGRPLRAGSLTRFWIDTGFEPAQGRPMRTISWAHSSVG